MGLTEQQFSRVRRAMRLTEAAAMEGPSCKRKSTRWSVDAIVAFAPCRDGGTGAAGTVNPEPPAKWVNLIDLSPSGASVLSKSQFAPGEYFVLALPGENDEHMAAVCTVQHSRVKLDGTFRIGAEFCDAAAPGAKKVAAALASLREMGLFVSDPGQPAAAPAPVRQAHQPRTAHRRSERRQAEGRAIIHTYDADGEPGPVEEVPALDFSETGVCIFRREPLQMGEQFMARVPLMNSGPIISLCRVTNVAPCEGGSRYRIGAEFISPPGIAKRIVRGVKKMFRSAA